LTIIFTLLLGVLSGAAGTFLIRRFALKHGIVNHPNPIVCQHTRPVAYLGGVGIAIGMVTTLSVAGITVPLRIALGAFLALLLGTLDDLLTLSPRCKLVCQLAVAITAVLCGLVPHIFESALLNGVLTVLAITVLMNAFNLTDVSDGLASLLIITASIGLGVMGADWLLALAVTGATAGFLLFNKPDASIFLGDAGSHLLGFMAAVLLLDPVHGSAGSNPGAWSLAGAVFCVGIPLFELVFLVVVRTAKGIPWFRGSPDHFALRLQKRGFTKWSVLGVTLVSGVVLCASGIAVRAGDPAERVLVLVLAMVASLIAGVALVRMDGDGTGRERR